MTVAVSRRPPAGGPPPQRRLTPAERRRRILDGALAVFARDGYTDASMADLGVAAGVTAPVLYRHFDSKQQLFLAVLDDQATLLASAIGEAIDPASAPLEHRLLKTASAIIDFATDRPDAWRLLRTTPPRDPVIAAAWTQLQTGARSLTAQTTASDPDFTPPVGIDRTAAAKLFGELQWTAYEALGDWASEHPQTKPTDHLRIFMDFIWIGLQRFRQGTHWN